MKDQPDPDMTASRSPRQLPPPATSRVSGWLGLVMVVALLQISGLAPAPLVAQGSVTLENLDGGTVSEADLSRGPTVVVVWASWSPRGRNIVERVRAIEGRWGSSSRVVTVNFQEEPQVIRDFLNGRSMGVPVLLDVDGVFAKKHAVTSLPGLLVFQGGRVAYRGSLPEDPTSVLREILE